MTVAVGLAADFSGAMDVLNATLERLGKPGSDGVAAFAMNRIREDSLRSFDTHANPSTGHGWAALKPSTLDWRSRMGMDVDPLVASGALYRSLYAAWGQTKKTGISYAMGIVEGDLWAHAQFALYGRRGGRGGAMDPRVFVGISPTSIRAVEDYGAHHYTEGR